MSEATVTKEYKITNFNFMGQRHVAMTLSVLLILGSFAGLWMKGLNLGIDFTGGTILEFTYPEAVDLQDIRSKLVEADYSQAVAQHFGSASDVLIRIAPREGLNSAQLSNQIMDVLGITLDSGIELRRVEFVGPQVGKELTEGGALAVLYALFGILIYVALRFEWRFSVGAVLALMHDVIITVGLFAWTQVQFDLTVVAALLAVIGYSLNDTIVVFDRVRENFRTMRESTAIQVINLAINQMLSRTIMTSVTTMLVLFALVFLGGEVIFGFALAMLVGVIVGTFSSTYVASAIALAMGVSKEDLMKAPKQGPDSEEQEAELQRLFLEQEIKREAREAKRASKQGRTVLTQEEQDTLDLELAEEKEAREAKHAAEMKKTKKSKK